MRVPASAPPDVQQAFRDIHAALTLWSGSADIDLHGRRLMNAHNAIDAHDYATLDDLRLAIKEMPAPAPPAKVAELTSLYGTHADRANHAPGSLKVGSLFFESDRGALYHVREIDGVATWVLYFAMMTGSYSAKPSDLTSTDDNFWYNAQDQCTLSRWTGAAWHYQAGILIDTWSNRPAGGGTNISAGFRFSASDRGYQQWAYDRTNTRWYYVGGGEPTRNTIANITGSLGAQDVGYLFYSTDYDRVFRWNGSAYEDAPGQPARGMIVYFDYTNLPMQVATAWALCDGSSATRSVVNGTTASYTTPNLTGSTRFIRSVSGTTGGTGGSATTHTHPVDPPSTTSSNPDVAGTGAESVTTIVQSGTGITVAGVNHTNNHNHTHTVDVASFNSGTPSGTSGDDALPPYLNLRPYVRL